MISEKYFKVNNQLDTYFMKPYYLDRLGLIYSISLYEYDDFSLLAREFILLDMNKRTNLAKQQLEKAKLEGLVDRNTKFEPLEQTHLFDWITFIIEQNRIQVDKFAEINEKFKGLSQSEIEEILQGNEEFRNFVTLALASDGKTIESSITKMISMTVKNEVIYEKVTKCFCIIENSEIIGVLDKDNFYEYRKIVMLQNILHEPRVGGNLQSQKYIDKELKALYGDSESSVESMVAFVCSSNSRDISDYTYYRLRADFTMEMRKLDYSVTNNYNANGCKTQDGDSISVPSITEPLGLDVNPYNKNAKEISEEELKKTTIKR